MADRLWSAWYDAVVPQAPGCPIAVVDYQIKRAAIEFCDKSGAWRKAVPDIDSVANTGEYSLPAVATGVKVVKLLECRFLGQALKPKRPDELEALYSPNEWRALTGPPLYFVQETPNMVRLVPAPTVTTVGAIEGMWASVRPTDVATGIEDATGSEYHQEIADGALKNIYAIPQKPYSNATLAGTYYALFHSHIGNAAYRAFRGNSKTGSRTETSYR